MNTKKPKIISTALMLLYGAWIISFIQTMLMINLLDFSYDLIGFPIAYLIFPVLLDAGLVFAITKRKNWARVVYTSCTMVGVSSLSSFMDIKNIWQIEPLCVLLKIAMLAVSIVAIALLFRPTATAWFKKQPEQ